MYKLIQLARRFAADQRGNLSVEAVLMLPVLVWTMIAFFAFWDVYRINYLAKKATFTVADIISRERAQIQQSFILRYANVFAYAVERPIAMTTSNATSMPFAMRVTSLGFTETNSGNTTTIMWSMSTDPARMPLRSTSGIADLQDRIPAMMDGDNIIVVETHVYWSPNFFRPTRGTAPSLDILEDLQTRTIETVTTVRPRFVPRVCFIASGLNIPCEL
jgi:Flp pilus assembly protein TadG